MSPEEIKYLTETLKMLHEMMETKPNEWLPVYAVLAGAIAGAITSFFPTLLIERRREKKFSRRVLASLIAEISALLEIIKHRGYHESIKEAVEHLKTQPAGSTYSLTVDVPKHYSRIFQDNCGNIGVIDEYFSQRIVIFHQLIDAVVQDIKPGGVASTGAELEAFEEMDKIFTRAIQVGNELV